MKESNIQTKIMIEASKLGAIPIRLNSGKAWQGTFAEGVIIHPRAIRLCPEGTPDLMLICPDGKMLWVECKTATGKQRESQKKFQEMLESKGHKYIICRNPSELKNFIK